MKHTLWNLQFHRTITSNRGTLSHDVYTLRLDDLNAPYFTISVPHGRVDMMRELWEAFNHRTVYEQPAPMPEIEAIFHGPWTVNSTTKTRYIIVTDKEERVLRNTYHALSAKNITLEHELETLKKAYMNLDKMYNLQSKVLQRARLSSNDEMPPERVDVPDLFKNADDYSRDVPKFDYQIYNKTGA